MKVKFLVRNLRRLYITIYLTMLYLSGPFLSKCPSIALYQMAMRHTNKIKMSAMTKMVRPRCQVNCLGSVQLLRQGFEHCKREKQAMM